MCIILVKPNGVKLPNKQVLETCFKNNSDGAGFMYSNKGQVHISKGYMDFASFDNALTETLKTIDELKTPMVLHFRITTQGGVNQACTHPFPLSRNMSDLRQLKFTTNIGIAHNGIIDLTTEGYYGYGSYNAKKIDYSDTMKFITDYLSLIIKSPKYYKDKDTLELIEKLVGSKLAILDGNGHFELIGQFTKDNGIYYSNESYKPRVYKTVTTKYTKNTQPKNKVSSSYTIFDEIENDDYSWGGYNPNYDYDDYEECYDWETGEYDFSYFNFCPIDDCIPDYCSMCANRNSCKKHMPIPASNYTIENGTKMIYPTKQFFRVNGELVGISYDDDDNFYEVYYEETYGNYHPYYASKLDNGVDTENETEPEKTK